MTSSGSREKQQHLCPVEGAVLDYVTVVIDESNEYVLMERCGEDCVTFPVVHSGEAPHFAGDMSACFKSKILAKCGTAYDLRLLHCTLNEGGLNHVILPHCALFVALGPRGRNGEGLADPRDDKFEWVYKPDIASGAEMLMSEDDYDGKAAAFRSTNRYMREGLVQPWELPKWHRGAPIKAVEQLRNLGYIVKDPFAQFRLTANATMLKTCLSNDEVVYFKFSHSSEVLITKAVSEFASFAAPVVLCCDVHEGWMVVRHHGETLGGKMTREDGYRILELYGALQLRSLSFIDELRSDGAFVNTADVIIERSEKLLNDKDVLSGIHSSYLQSPDSFGRLKGRTGDDSECILARIEERLCSTVRTFFKLLFEKCGIPIVIVHGDLYDENVVVAEKKLTIIDWGSARLDIPFGDLSCLRIEHLLPDKTGEAASDVEDGRMEDLGIENYLSMWKAYGSMDFLKLVYKASTLKATYETILDDYEGNMKLRLSEKLKLRSQRILSSIFNDMEVLSAAISKSVAL